ncbi:MAG: sigma-70 family RNA polymerase sigma factor [Pirellulales bacterium]
MNDLLEHHAAAVFRFALRMTGDHHAAEDVAQEALLRAWRKRSGLDDTRATRAWLLTIAANVWRDQLRRAKLRRSESLPADGHASREPSPLRTVTARDEASRAVALMDTLPARQREVLYLFSCEGLSLEEIAAVLATNRDAVKANLHLARKRMRSLWSNAKNETIRTNQKRP